MTNSISKKYSKALFMATQSKENTQKVLGELETIYRATFSHADIKAYFSDPLTDAQTKIASFQKATPGEMLAQETRDFVSLLIKNKRFGHLGTIISDVRGLIDAEQGIQRGVIKSAQPLDPQVIKNIEAEFEKILKSKVHLEFQSSPEGVGGIVAEVAGFTFDDSLQNHLNKLSDNLIRH